MIIRSALSCRLRHTTIAALMLVASVATAQERTPASAQAFLSEVASKATIFFELSHTNASYFKEGEAYSFRGDDCTTTVLYVSERPHATRSLTIDWRRVKAKINSTETWIILSGKGTGNTAAGKDTTFAFDSPSLVKRVHAAMEFLIGACEDNPKSSTGF